MNRFIVLLLALPLSVWAQNDRQDHQGHQQVQDQQPQDHQDHVGHQGHEGREDPQDQQETMDHQEHQGHEGHQMTVDADGVVMNENLDRLPRGCDAISRDHHITIHAGQKYAGEPGMIFGMSEHEVNVEPCSRVKVHFVNEDEVRHQWMVHGLPKYLYPAGMFHIEASGGTSQSGTFIVPAESRNYLIHCDVAQHMEMGMRGQLVVGAGGGDLWGIAGVSDAFLRSSYLPRRGFLWSMAILALCASILCVWFLTVNRSRR